MELYSEYKIMFRFLVHYTLGKPNMPVFYALKLHSLGLTEYITFSLLSLQWNSVCRHAGTLEFCL